MKISEMKKIIKDYLEFGKRYGWVIVSVDSIHNVCGATLTIKWQSALGLNSLELRFSKRQVGSLGKIITMLRNYSVRELKRLNAK